MLETKEQKQIFFGSVCLIIILLAISFWNRPNLQMVNKPNLAQQNKDFINSQAYLDYLRSAKIDPKASQELFQTILTQDQIKQEVENKLQVSQKIIHPTIDANKISIIASSNQSVNDYLNNSLSHAYSFNTNTTDLTQKVFNTDPNAGVQLQVKLNQLTNKLYNLPVPKEALAMHKALLQIYLAYADLLNSAKSFDPNGGSENDAVWPEVYKNYVIANDGINAYTQELAKISAKYKISSIYITYQSDSSDVSSSGNFLIPKASAFGVGSFTFTIGDIPRIISDSVQESLRSAFLQFMGNMLNNLISKIEQNYVIANFLYYSDALVNGQYVDDYLNKYVNDPLDKNIIKNFIPQFACGKNSDLKNVFLAKANQHLGFDPSTLDTSDPSYYQKMAQVGDFLSTPQGWDSYYHDAAAQAESAAQKAVDRELSSSGLKTPRDSSNSSINISVNNIVSAERASFSALLQLGINNANSLISNVVATLTQTLVNKFVFQGVSANSGSIVVLKEQKTCLDTAVVTPVLPLPQTQYQQPSAPPTVQAALAGQCAIFTTLGTDCSSAVLGELSICVNNSTQHTGSLSCKDLAQSAYVKTWQIQCSSLIRPTTECVNLQNYLTKIH